MNKTTCHLIKEHHANNKNAHINSLTLDAATLLIPLGGPFLLAKLAHRFNKINKASAKSILLMEGAAIAVNTDNIKGEYDYCQKLDYRFIATENISNQLKEQSKKCKEVINNITISYTLAFLGGGLALGPGLKYLSKEKINQIQQARRSQKSFQHQRQSREVLDKITEAKKHIVIDEFTKLGKALKKVHGDGLLPLRLRQQYENANIQLISFLKEKGIKAKLIGIPKDKEVPWGHTAVEILAGDKKTLFGKVVNHKDKYLRDDQKIILDQFSLSYLNAHGFVNHDLGLVLGNTTLKQLDNIYDETLFHEIHHAKNQLKTSRGEDTNWDASLNILHKKDDRGINSFGYEDYFSMDEISTFMKGAKQKITKREEARKYLDQYGPGKMMDNPELLEAYEYGGDIASNLNYVKTLSKEMSETIDSFYTSQTGLYIKRLNNLGSYKFTILIEDKETKLSRVLSITIHNIKKDDRKLQIKELGKKLEQLKKTADSAYLRAKELSERIEVHN